MPCLINNQKPHLVSDETFNISLPFCIISSQWHQAVTQTQAEKPVDVNERHAIVFASSSTQCHMLDCVLHYNIILYQQNTVSIAL